jgi:Papain-like cysteine protease AvrRpt2
MPKLPFIMQTQLQTNWCWAAVSASISSFFGGPAGASGGPWQQCEVANCALTQTACCMNGASPACNQDWYLEEGLTCVSHLAGPVSSGPSPYANIKNEIDNDRPVGVRIGWYGDGGHFVCVTGYDDSTGTQFVNVDDPWYGPSTYEYTAFGTAYQSGAGGWTHTYPIA